MTIYASTVEIPPAIQLPWTSCALCIATIMAVPSSSPDYAKGSISGDWYHGELTRVEAEQALRASGHDCFLIRESRGLVLSFINSGRTHHIKFAYGPGYYKLKIDSEQEKFAEIEDLVSYYRSHYISDSHDSLKVKLGNVCMKQETKAGSRR